MSGTAELISLQSKRPSRHSSKSWNVSVGIGRRFPTCASPLRLEFMWRVNSLRSSSLIVCCVDALLPLTITLPFDTTPASALLPLRKRDTRSTKSSSSTRPLASRSTSLSVSRTWSYEAFSSCCTSLSTTCRSRLPRSSMSICLNFDIRDIISSWEKLGYLFCNLMASIVLVMRLASGEDWIGAGVAM